MSRGGSVTEILVQLALREARQGRQGLLPRHAFAVPEAWEAAGPRSTRARAVRETRVGMVAAAALVVATALSTPGPAFAAAAGPSWTVPPQATMLVLGDSWTAGDYVGAGNTFTQDAADDMGWRTEMYGISGAGYLNAVGSDHMTYPKKAAQLNSSLNPSIIVVQGGSNNWHRDLSKLAGAATQTITTLRHTFPKAVILMVGPGMDMNPLPSSYVQIDQILSQVASRQHVFWTSILSWIKPKSFSSIISSADGHPTVAGDVYLGWRLAQTFRGYTGQGTLGKPTGDLVTVVGQGSSGLTQTFQSGDLYAGPAGAWPVSEGILTSYKTSGGPAGGLGWPPTDTYADQNGSVQRFQSGAIYVDGHRSFIIGGALFERLPERRWTHGPARLAHRRPHPQGGSRSSSTSPTAHSSPCQYRGSGPGRPSARNPPS